MTQSTIAEIVIRGARRPETSGSGAPERPPVGTSRVRESAPGATGGVDDPTIYSQVSEWERRGEQPYGTIVAWGLPACQKAKLRTLVERLVGKVVSGKIRSIRQIRQRDERTRTLIEIQVGSRLEAIRKLQRAGEVHARVGRRNGDKVAEPRVVVRGDQRPRTQGPGTDRVRRDLNLCTWNIGGSFRRKKPWVAQIGDSEKADIVALQETNRDDGQYPCRLVGYDVYDSASEAHVPGRRGVALAVNRTLSSFEVQQPHPNWVWARVFLPGEPGKSMLVSSIYLPSDRKVRKPVLDDLRKVLQRILNENPEERIVLMGDFNMSHAAIAKALSNWQVPLSVVPKSGSPKTFHRAGRSRWSDIDHLCASETALDRLTRCRVRRQYDFSDHFPVVGRLRLDEERPEAATQGTRPIRRPRVDMMSLMPRLPQIANHNRFAVLAESMSTETDHNGATNLDTLVAQFTSHHNETLGDVLGSECAGPVRQMLLSHKARRVLAQRRAAWKQVAALQEAGQEVPPALNERYVGLREKSQKVVQEDRLRSWNRFLARGTKMATDGDFHALWRWIRKVKPDTNGGHRTYPMRNASGELTNDLAELLEIWARHAKSLYEDSAETTAATTTTATEGTGAGDADGTTMQRAGVEVLNQPIRWEEVMTVARKMRAHKAPGPDEVDQGIVKAILMQECIPTEPDPVAPCSPYTRVLFAILQQSWISGKIPELWKTAHLVPIPKKGDLSSPENYRTISLMSTLLKLLLAILTQRLNKYCETNKILGMEQAGFRRHEESVAQATALYEAIRRRLAKDLPTIGLFIDFKKAYDTVPHDVLFARVRSIGVQGRFMSFLEELYANSELKVRLKGQESRAIRVRRGVRQGCPLSPLLFNIFINDILDGCENDALDVPGQTMPMRGLLFADDVVILSDSPDRLRQNKERVEAWASRSGMTFGVAKCGVMYFGASPGTETWELQGQSVNVVEYYDYLGLRIDSRLSLETIVAERARKGKRALHAMNPFLRMTTVPLQIKLLVTRATLVPVLTYGAELFGMSLSRTMELDRILAEGLRLALGINSKASPTSRVILFAETGIPPVSGQSARLRARAYLKYPNLRTWVANLTRDAPETGKTWSWARGCREGIRRAGTSNAQGDTTTGMLDRVTWQATRSLMERSSAVSVSRYREARFVQSRTYVQELLGKRVPLGTLLLARARLNCLPDFRRSATARLIAPVYRDRCPFCTGGPDTLYHHLCVCPEWQSERDKYLAPLLIAIETEMSIGSEALDDGTIGRTDEELRRETLLLGGSSSATGRPIWDANQIGTGLQSANERPDVPSALVASFLESTYRKRRCRYFALRAEYSRATEATRADAHSAPEATVEVALPTRVDAQGGYGSPDTGHRETERGEAVRPIVLVLLLVYWIFRFV